MSINSARMSCRRNRAGQTRPCGKPPRDDRQGGTGTRRGPGAANETARVSEGTRPDRAVPLQRGRGEAATTAKRFCRRRCSSCATWRTAPSTAARSGRPTTRHSRQEIRGLAEIPRQVTDLHSSTVTVPLPPSMRNRCPVFSRRCTSAMPATAGRPNSRATIAPCDSTPPVSITRPFAWTNNGTHAGSVVGHTRM